METDLTTLIARVLGEFDAPAAITRETPLFGPDGIMDSLGLVSFIVAVEQAIEDVYGVAISLADDKAMSQRQSPYRTVGSLVDYARAQLNGSETVNHG